MTKSCLNYFLQRVTWRRYALLRTPSSLSLKTILSEENCIDYDVTTVAQILVTHIDIV